MNFKVSSPRRHAVIAAGLLLLGALGLSSRIARADDAIAIATNAIVANVTSAVTTTNDEEIAAAWRAVRKAMQPPMPPASWQANPPTRTDVDKFYSPLVLLAADEAKSFYTKYPNDAHAAEAHKIELDMLNINATRFEDTSQNARLDAVKAARMADPNASEDEKFEFRAMALRPLFAGRPGTLDELVKGLLALQKDFPKREETYQIMLIALMDDETEAVRPLAQRIAESPAATEKLQTMTQGFLRRLDNIGKPVDIQFTAVDGREVSLAKLKGKVVLVDFWATWCPPCMALMPMVHDTYQKLHAQGFEIVGISLDQDRGALIKTVAQKEMAWPQYFDGAGWQNKYAVLYGLNHVPTMWLIDRQGNLRDTKVELDLPVKAAKLLLEPEPAGTASVHTADLAK